MKQIILYVILVSNLFSSIVTTNLLSIDDKQKNATIKLENANIGMSGFIIHNLNDTHSVILNNIVITQYDKNSSIATIKLSEFHSLDNDALPIGNWKVSTDDKAVLAFGYSRGILIAPSEEIYYRITKATNLQWIHPDLFATILSMNGHPTPLKEDFDQMSENLSIGLIFVYINQKLFTLDAKSFKILNISEAPLKQEKIKLPFYTRVKEINANWFGEGSNELKSYAPYYYKLLVQHNKKNKELVKIINNSTNSSLKEKFEIGEEL